MQVTGGLGDEDVDSDEDESWTTVKTDLTYGQTKGSYIIQPSTVGTKGYQSKDCNLTGLFSKTTTKSWKHSQVTQNSQVLFSEPTVGGRHLSRAVKRQAKAAERANSNIYHHLGKNDNQQGSYRDAVLSSHA